MEGKYRAEITGVFGDPVDDNPTGVMTEAAYKDKGLNYRYLTLRVTPEGFEDAVRSIRALNMKGINLTMPHKIAVLKYLDDMSEAARIIGAVNTIVVRDGKLIGENTDGKGFVQALRNSGSEPAGKNIVILGAGGAARAIAVECALAGASKVTIVNRTEEKAKELADLVREHTKADAVYSAWTPGFAIPEGTDILINATSIGFAPDSESRPDIDYSTISEGMTVSDVVFCPARTSFLAACEENGAKTVNGLGMLACQGALNFKIWTGQDAPLEVMEKTLARELGQE